MMMMIDTIDVDLEIFTAVHLPGNLELFDTLITINYFNLAVFITVFITFIISSVFPFNFRKALDESVT